MDRHYCKQCGKSFSYCRGCVLTPIPYKAAGFCSSECSTTFKAPKIEIPIEATEAKEIQDDNSIENDGIHE